MGAGTPVRTADMMEAPYPSTSSSSFSSSAAVATAKGSRNGRPNQRADGDRRVQGARVGAAETPAVACNTNLDGDTVGELAAAVDRGVLPPNDLGAAADDDQNVVIVSHGLLIRLFIGRWFRVPMEVFETMCNPPNCSITVLERHDDLNRLVMTDVSKQLFGSDPLLQMMRFDGREDTQWYRERFLGIIDPAKDVQRSMQTEDDDENHYSKSKTPDEYEPPANLLDYPPVPRPRSPSSTSSSPSSSFSSVNAGSGSSSGSASRKASARSTEGTRGAMEKEEKVEEATTKVSWTHEGAPSLSATSQASAKSASSPPPWSFEMSGGYVPNVGPGEDSAELKERLQKHLSRGFW